MALACPIANHFRVVAEELSEWELDAEGDCVGIKWGKRNDVRWSGRGWSCGHCGSKVIEGGLWR